MRLLPAILCVFVLLGSAKATHLPRLRFRQNGSFKLVQLTDLHFGEGKVKDASTEQVYSCLQCRPAPCMVSRPVAPVSHCRSFSQHSFRSG